MKTLFLFLVIASSSIASAQSLDQIQGEIRTGRYDLAERELKAGLQEHPNSARGYYDLAYVEYKLSNFHAAHVAIKQCLRLDPGLSFAHNTGEVREFFSEVSAAPDYPSASRIRPEHSGGSGLAVILLLSLVLLLIGGIVLWVIRWLLSPRPTFSTYDHLPSAAGGPGPTPAPLTYPTTPPGNSTTTFLEGMALGGIGGALIDEALRPRPDVIQEERYVEPSTPPANDVPFDGGHDSWSNDNNSGGGDSGSADNGGGFDVGGNSSDSSNW